MNEKVSLQTAADMLGVSRRRAQAFVDTNVLTGPMIGTSRALDTDDIRHIDRVRRHRAGKPLTAEHAWRRIAELDPGDIDQLDADRRRVRTRAEHLAWYVHQSILSKLRAADDRRRVLSGSDAAAAHNVPVGGPNELLHMYIHDSELSQLESRTRPERRTPATANLVVHAVPDADWPFHGERHAALNVAWLDMADHGERGQDLVLDVWRRSR
jgi:hypothetical protein